MSDPQNVYIGRRGIVFVTDSATGEKVRWPPKDSPFANPFKVNGDGEEAADGRNSCIQKYRLHLLKQIEDGTITREMLLSLCGKTLGCWCKPEACHGDVIVEQVLQFIV